MKKFYILLAPLLIAGCAEYEENYYATPYGTHVISAYSPNPTVLYVPPRRNRYAEMQRLNQIMQSSRRYSPRQMYEVNSYNRMGKRGMVKKRETPKIATPASPNIGKQKVPVILDEPDML